MKMRIRVLAVAITMALPIVGGVVDATSLPGFGEVSGSVSGIDTDVIPLYFLNREMNVGYSVFVVDGKYRVTNVFPGTYEVRVENGFAPSPVGLRMAPASVVVTRDSLSQLNLDVAKASPTLNYTGREAYPDGVVVQPYDEIYPQGPGRKILEHSCIVCHGVNFIPSKTTSREGWSALIHLMTQPQGAGGLFSSQLSSGAPIVNHERLSPEDMPVLLDYLEKNFGPDKEQRAVLQGVWPAVDRSALAKAQFIEYRFPNLPNEKRGSHSLNFDSKGLVYVSDPTDRAVWQVDPATGATKQFKIPGGESTHGIVVDGDDTVWIAGSGHFLAHLDPKTGRWDRYKTRETGMHANTPVLGRDGNIWFSQLIGNGIGHWDRKTDRVTYYTSPVPNADPYGLDIDHDGKVWYSEYFAGAITKFDPTTEEFTRYKVQTWPNSLRRLTADSKNNIWFGVYGYMGEYGRLGRIDAETGEMTEIVIPIQYGQPYDARTDVEDKVWIASMNYITRFDPSTLRFTVYPLPERTDEPKPEVTADGAVWYAPRWASFTGYGGAAVVLFPDKDKISTLRAIPSEKLSNWFVGSYRGPFTPVKGVIKWQSEAPKNKVTYRDVTRGRIESEGGTVKKGDIKLTDG